MIKDKDDTWTKMTIPGENNEGSNYEYVFNNHNVINVYLSITVSLL